MRPCLRQIYICLIPTFCVIGIPLLVYGGLNIPHSLTKEESIYAQNTGTPHINMLRQKQINSAEYKQMLIGGGFFGTSILMLVLCAIGMTCCSKAIIHPEEEDLSTTSPDACP